MSICLHPQLQNQKLPIICHFSSESAKIKHLQFGNNDNKMKENQYLRLRLGSLKLLLPLQLLLLLRRLRNPFPCCGELLRRQNWKNYCWN